MPFDKGAVVIDLLSARWFRAIAVAVLLCLLLWVSNNRIVVFIGNHYFEPTYELCIAAIGVLADDVTQLERQIVCNITMIQMVADAEREIAAQ